MVLAAGRAAASAHVEEQRAAAVAVADTGRGDDDMAGRPGPTSPVATELDECEAALVLKPRRHARLETKEAAARAPAFVVRLVIVPRHRLA